jgi:hypothetical protein
LNDDRSAVNFSYFHKLLLAADPFSVFRANFRGWKRNRPAPAEPPKRSRARHLTCKQREDIASGLQDSMIGPVSMTATASDSEAINYQNEIANVLEETGFDVEIDDARKNPSEPEITAGLEMIIKDETIRPVHALSVVRAFRRAGLTIATRINALRRNNMTLYIAVGPKEGAAAIPLPAAVTTVAWPSQSMTLLFAKWKKRFAL